MKSKSVKRAGLVLLLILSVFLLSSAANVNAQTIPSSMNLSITVISPPPPQFISLATSTNPNNSISATIPTTTEASTTSNNVITTVNIPNGTVITGPSSWNGILTFPEATTTFFTAPTPRSGYNISVETAVEVGAGDTPLTLDQAAELTFAGQAGKLIGWSQSGIFTQITDTCDANNGDTTVNGGGMFLPGGNCAFNNDGNGNLIVWTKHFSTFIIYTQTLIPTTPTSNNAGKNGGGGGGGGGGGDFFPIQTTSATFLGRAYPSSYVTVLQDGQIKASTVAGPDSNFNISISGLSGGNYIFSIYSEDNSGNRSSLVTFPISVTAGASTQISGIFIAPTIGTDKSTVKKGDNIAIFGQSTPNGKITISVGSENQVFKQVNADKNGAYLLNFDTSPLEMGNHIAKSKSTIGDEISPLSAAIGFVVGNTTVLKPKNEPINTKVDLNGDGKVNLVDFSIMAFWYGKPNPPKKFDLNGDGKINLIDLSILAHYWSG